MYATQLNIMPWSREKGPMGDVPYIRLKQGMG